MSGQDCYDRNGNHDLGMFPCSIVDEDLTHCCGDGSHCATNGLCARKSGSEAQSDRDFRYNIGGCTVEDWDSDGCIQHCKDVGFFVQSCNNYNGDDAGFSCVNGSTNEFDCNTSRDSFFTLSNVRLLPTSTTTTSPSTSETGNSATPTPSGDDSGDSDDSGGNNALAIGLGVGLGVAAIAIIGLAAWFIIRRRRNRQKDDVPPGIGFENYKPVGDVSASNTNAATAQWQQTDTPKTYQDYSGAPHNAYADTAPMNTANTADPYKYDNGNSNSNGYGANTYYEPGTRSPPVYEAPGNSIATELPGAGENGR